MPGPRSTIDEAELIRLLTTLPAGWSYSQLAWLLTEHNTAVGRPALVSTPSVRTRAHRLRARDAFKGMTVHWPNDVRKGTLVSVLVANSRASRVHPDHLMDTDLLRLRQLDRIRNGRPVSSNGTAKYNTGEAETARAVAFEQRLRRERQVIALTSGGVPFRRPAFAWELDENHELIDIIASPQPEGCGGDADTRSGGFSGVKPRRKGAHRGNRGKRETKAR
jgi:hypothetical protein